MICPKCRKNYTDGVEFCPECGSPLIALMGEADAPVDRNNDCVSSIGVISSVTSENAPQAPENGDFAAEAAFADEESVSEAEENLGSDETFYETQGENSSATEGFSLEFSDTDDYADDGIKIFAPSDYDEGEPDNAFVREPAFPDEEYNIAFDDEGGEYADYAENEEYSEDEQYSEDEEYEEYAEYDEGGEYEQDYADGEENSDRLYGENGQSETQRSAVKGTYYKPYREGEAEEALAEKKKMNILTGLIFAAAVAFVIASVVCFVLGSATELTEMDIIAALFENFGY